MEIMEIILWVSFGLLAYTHLIYPLVWMALARLRGRSAVEADGYLPTVDLIIACYNEEDVIGHRLENALSLDYPREKLKIAAAMLVPPGNDAHLGAAITRLLQDPGARKRLALESERAATGPFSWDAIAEQTRRLDEQLVR